MGLCRYIRYSDVCGEPILSLSLHHLRISLPLYTIPRSDLASSTSQHENRSSSPVDVEMASQNVFTRLAITWHVMLITMTSCWATLSKGPGWIITISSSHTHIYVYIYNYIIYNIIFKTKTISFLCGQASVLNSFFIEATCFAILRMFKQAAHAHCCLKQRLEPACHDHDEPVILIVWWGSRQIFSHLQ